MNFYRILALILCLLLTAGCAGGGSAPGAAAPTSAPDPVPTPVPSSAPVPRPDVERPAVKPVFTGDSAAAFSNFGVALLRASRTEGTNTLLSPLSVALALGMTANGAQGDTLKQFEAVFGMDLETLNSLCAQMLADYSALGGSTEANLVNSLWADPVLDMEDDFLAMCMDIYGAQLFQQDLQDPATVKQVNDWVKEATRGMIPSIVNRFEDETVLALINAVYLKNRFESPFVTPTSEWTLDFVSEDGQVTHPQGMSNGERREAYIVADKGRGVLLPYDDGKLGLLLMLPEEGVTLTEFLADWDGNTPKTLLDSRRDALVILSAPKFKTEWSGSLVDVLEEMGLSDAFSPDLADFSKLGSAQGEPLYISDVIHKTAFEMNEKGTEAAAVTMVTVDAACYAMPTEEPIVLRFDRPFVYAIVDLETGTPLFLGTLERAE